MIFPRRPSPRPPESRRAAKAALFFSTKRRMAALAVRHLLPEGPDLPDALRNAGGNGEKLLDCCLKL